MRRERRSPDVSGHASGGMSLSSLIQALAVAEHLNFRHAANALGVTQSSVSARIKALEEELGVLLFERNTRGVRLTDTGCRFVKEITAAVDQLNNAVKNASMAAKGECGRLCVGIQGLIPGSFLDGLLARYRVKHPAISLEMVEGSTREVMHQLRARQVDVAFLIGMFELPDCHSRQIWTEQLLIAMPEGHRLARRSEVTWDELAEEVFLVRHGGTGQHDHDHIALRLSGRWPPPTIQRFEVERSTLMSMIAQGFGVSLLGAASTLCPIGGVVFLPFSDEPEPVGFSAVWSPHNRNPALRELLDLAT